MSARLDAATTSLRGGRGLGVEAGFCSVVAGGGGSALCGAVSPRWDGTSAVGGFRPPGSCFDATSAFPSLAVPWLEAQVSDRDMLTSLSGCICVAALWI